MAKRLWQLKSKKVTLFEIFNVLMVRAIGKLFFVDSRIKKKKKKEEGVILEIGGKSAKNADTSHVLRRGGRQQAGVAGGNSVLLHEDDPRRYTEFRFLLWMRRANDALPDSRIP